MKKFSLISLFLFVVLDVIYTFPQSPLDIIKTSNQEVLDILAGRETIDSETRDKLLKVIDEVTDFTGISRQVTERFCKNLEPEQCETFNEVFQELLRSTSVKKLGRYRADSFEYLREHVEGSTAVVETIARYEEDQIQLNYYLERQEEKWQVVNYVVDDVDTIRNYKKQFIRLFAKNSFDEVMKRLRNKITKNEKEYLQQS
jgi:phospholipid transport system substrate-binding protein